MHGLWMHTSQQAQGCLSSQIDAAGRRPECGSSSIWQCRKGFYVLWSKGGTVQHTKEMMFEGNTFYLSLPKSVNFFMLSLLLKKIPFKFFPQAFPRWIESCPLITFHIILVYCFSYYNGIIVRKESCCQGNQSGE